MLIGLKRPLKEGESVPMTLTFEGGATMNIELAIKGVGASDHGY